MSAYTTEPKKISVEERKLRCTAEQTDVGGAAFVPVPSSGSGPRAEQLVLKMHVSSAVRAASFGFSACQGTQMAVHGLDNLSWDYLLNSDYK